MTSTKSVIVTGASRGIGRAVATRLSRDGFAVTVNYAGNASKADEVVAEIKTAGGQAIAVQGDVANAEHVERLFKKSLDTFGGTNVVVNCAGIMPLLPITGGDLELFDNVITTNLRGTFVVLGRASQHISTGGRIDFSLMLNKRILLANIIIVVVGYSMFTVFQTIPILVQNPQPVGFGGDPISAAKLQLPFALIILVFGAASGLIITRLGSMKTIIIGTVVGAIGFFALEIFHSTEFLLSLNLGIVAIGISLSSVGAQNVIILSIPRQNSGMSLGFTTFLRILGSAIAPAVAGMLLQQYQYTANIGGTTQSFPSSEAYNLIFLIASILSIISVCLALVLIKSRPAKCQNHLPEEEGTMGTIITDNIKKEILSWAGVRSNPYRFGGIEFQVNNRDMGHIHGEKLADLPFPMDIRKGLIASGKALPHIIYPESMWVSYIIRSEEDCPKIIELFRLQRLRHKPKIISPR
jgi:hypothetical protein